MALSETDTIPLPPITPGVVRALSPLLRRVAVKSKDDKPGVNTYLIGIDEIVILDPGPLDQEHLDIITGCGGERIRWIALTKDDIEHSESALKLKELTNAQLIAPADFEGVDEILGDGYKIDATEFSLIALSTKKSAEQNHFIYSLEQERTLFTGIEANQTLDEDLIDKTKPYRLKSIAPGFGQFIEDARTQLNK